MDIQSEQSKLEIPVAVQVVAWLMILTGVWGGLGILFSLGRGGLFLDLKVLYLFVGIGLLKLRNGWRVCALVFLAVGGIACALTPVFAFFVERPLLYRVPRHSGGLSAEVDALGNASASGGFSPFRDVDSHSPRHATTLHDRERRKHGRHLPQARVDGALGGLVVGAERWRDVVLGGARHADFRNTWDSDDSRRDGGQWFNRIEKTALRYRSTAIVKFSVRTNTA